MFYQKSYLFLCMYYVEYLKIYVICEDCDAIRICQVIIYKLFKKYIFANLNIGGTKTPYSPQWWFLKKTTTKICIASLVSFRRLLGHLLWLTGNCVQLNCSILLDGYKKRSSLRQRSREKTEECRDHRLYHETPPGRDTVKGHKYRFLFIFLLTACFTSVLVCITNCTMCK